MMSVYVADSSSLTNPHRQIPTDVFPSVRGRLESEINAGRLIAPREVRKEIEKKNDALSQWISEHPGTLVKRLGRSEENPGRCGTGLAQHGKG